jgi:ribonucleotide reductase beta subunit family protein with ferritin-like domain
MEPEYKLGFEKVKEIITEAVNIAKAFIAKALPVGLNQMNAQLMGEYIESQADNLVTLINVPVIYGTRHNFHFMDNINATNRTNFFERRPSEYSKAVSADTTTFEISDDF